MCELSAKYGFMSKYKIIFGKVSWGNRLLGGSPMTLYRTDFLEVHAAIGLAPFKLSNITVPANNFGRTIKIAASIININKAVTPRIRTEMNNFIINICWSCPIHNLF